MVVDDNDSGEKSLSFALTYLAAAEKKRECNAVDERAGSSLQKKASSPLFFPLFLLIFCRISAASCSSYSLVFPLFNQLPLECVLLENNQHFLIIVSMKT
jgi:hypothetical protein